MLPTRQSLPRAAKLTASLPAAKANGLAKKGTKAQAVQDQDAVHPPLQELNADDEATKAAAAAAPKRKRVKREPGQTPFPDLLRPTPEECREVNRLLESAHGSSVRPEIMPDPDPEISGCGEVPSVLDALLRTILSASTSNANSARALQGLIKKFGVVPKVEDEKVKDEKVEDEKVEDEKVKDIKQEYAIQDRGSVDWDAVRRAPREDLFEAIKNGGLADIKSKSIKGILDQVWEEGKVRKKQQREAQAAALSTSSAEGMNGTLNGPTIKIKIEEDRDIVDTGMEKVDSPGTAGLVDTGFGDPDDHSDAESILTTVSELERREDDGELSLEYLRDLDDNSAKAKLTSFKGVGPKTASCVLLFCLNRNSFAVDTHVFRISKFLGWIPDKSNHDTAYEHLDVRIPDDLKYSLHNLLIRHGRTCKHCRGGPERKNPEKPVKPKREKVELDEEGNPIKKKKQKKVWVGNGVMKQTLIDVDSADEGGELEQETCVIEHLVNRVRAPRKEKAKDDETESDGDIDMEGDEVPEDKPELKKPADEHVNTDMDADTEYVPIAGAKRKRKAKKGDTAEQIKEGPASEGSPRPKRTRRARGSTVNEDESTNHN